MTKVVTPSEAQQGITAGQAGKMGETLAARCRKNSSSLPSNIVQDVLHEEGDELAEEHFVALRTRVERRMNMIVRRVTVNRASTPDQVIDATGRIRGYIEPDVLATMPGLGGEIEVVEACFFDLDYNPMPEELDRELALRHLTPDPAALALVNTDDPAFADERSNATQWRDVEGRACCVIFDRWVGGRRVGVGRFDDLWLRRFRFGGSRKPAASAAE